MFRLSKRQDGHWQKVKLAGGLLLLLILTFVLGGCMYLRVAPELPDVIIPDTTRVVDEETEEQLEVVIDGGEVLVFDRPTAFLDQLQPGHVMVFGVTDKTPYGLLRKVEQVKRADDRVIVETVQATLEDAITQGVIELSKVLTPEHLAEAVALKPGVRMVAPQKRVDPKLIGVPQPFRYELEDVELRLGITLSGYIEFSPRFDFRVDIGPWYQPRLRSVLSQLTVTTTAEIEVTSEVSLVVKERGTIALHKFKTITLWAGKVPVLITPVLYLDVGVDGQVRVGISPELACSLMIKGGVRYDRNRGWTTISGYEWNFDSDMRLGSVIGNVDAIAFAGPMLGLKIYGVRTVYGTAHAFLQFTGEAAILPRRSSWQLYGGLRAGAGVGVKVLSREWIDMSWPDLFRRKWLVRERGVAVIAHAGPDQRVPVGTLVRLDGSRSSDPDGLSLTFRWTQIAGQPVRLSNDTAMKPMFIAPEGTYCFQLIVSAGGVDSAPDEVTIIAAPQPPTVRITSPLSWWRIARPVFHGTPILFQGSATDPEDGRLTGTALVWTSTIDGRIGTGESFTKDDLSVGTHTIILTATDSAGTGETDSLRLLVLPPKNQPPTAAITSPRDGSTFSQGAAIAFRGSATDREDGRLTGASLVWVSDVDGKIGTGESFTKDDLSVGTHTIVLIATDSQGATGGDAVTITVQGQQDPVVTFPDPNLERVIRTAINRPTGPIRRSDLIALTHLNAKWENISDLTGMEYLTNLTWLVLAHNQISAITPLAGLTNLTWLGLSGNQISDLAPLAGLTNLTGLWLGGNQISDLAPLARLTNLTKLFLGHNQIRDLTPLAGLTNLTGLLLLSNQISDITPLARLTNLTFLELGNNQISGITPLAGLTNLTRLELDHNHINDITPLARLTNLTGLGLGGNRIRDLTPLAGLTNLTRLELWHNQISNLAPLVANTGLGAGDTVDLRGNPLDLARGSPNMRDIEELRRRGVHVEY